jgi:tetratricopeptide (TPR) repeat protein
MPLWHRLWQADAFWEHLADAACKNNKRDAVALLRQDLPCLLLQVHYDIAFDPATPNHRAKFHISHALNSPFPPEFAATARRNTYNRIIGAVPSAVWQVNELSPEVIKQGTDAIRKYLEIDPGCIPALEDALRLQVRLLRAWYTALQAGGTDESPERTERLSTFRAAATEWRPYLDQLVPHAPSLESDTRQQLGLWYRVMADVHRSLDKHVEAIPLYEAGMRAANDDDDDRKQCVKGSGETHAFVAREKVHNGSTAARATCDLCRRRGADLSLFARFLLANAYALLNEFDIATEVCKHGLDAPVDDSETDYDAIEASTRDRERLAEMLQSIEKSRRHHQTRELIEKAEEHLKEGRFADGVRVLGDAAAKAPDNAMIFFMRCQCHLGLDHAAEAERDLVAFKRLEKSPEGIQAAAKLEQDVRKHKETAKKFGPETLRLRREATKKHAANDLAAAIVLLRQAIAACPTAGRKEVEQELSIILANGAVSSANEAISSKDSADRRLVACRQAVADLEEATRLDPANKNTRENLKAIKEVIAQMDELVQKYGSERTLELQQQAVRAYNEKRNDQAIALMRQALKESKDYMHSDGAPAVKTELSMMLAGLAVAKVNNAGAHSSIWVRDEAKRMLEEAFSLDPNNTVAMQNLAILMGMDRGY